MALSDNSLGRSLSEVFAKTVRREPVRGYLEVDITQIAPPGLNPRQDFDAQALQELAASVRQHGILQPIVVIKRETGYEVLSGERRLRAAKLAGLTKIPVVVRDETNPQHLAELRLIENIQRENLNPIELAQAYQALIDQHQLTHEALADRLNKERSSISNSVRLLTLPPDLQAHIASGTLSAGHAKVLAGIGAGAWQVAVAQQIIEQGLSVRVAERLAKDGPPRTTPRSGGKSAHVKELETNLFHLFGTRVSVTERNGKGSVSLHFDSHDHFQRVVAIMDRIIKQANAGEVKPPA
jgi:ParB family chromosome partitioning protein